jgi:hypothetical protein
MRSIGAAPTDWIATTARLDEMLRAADVFVVCAALTTETAGLIGERELALMQGDAIFINVARGEIVDEAALYAHLAAHPRFFAGIDAWWVEPVRHGRFAMGHPFLNLPNVIGSPHNSAGGVARRISAPRRAQLPTRAPRRGPAEPDRPPRADALIPIFAGGRGANSPFAPWACSSRPSSGWPGLVLRSTRPVYAVANWPSGGASRLSPSRRFRPFAATAAEPTGSAIVDHSPMQH